MQLRDGLQLQERELPLALPQLRRGKFAPCLAIVRLQTKCGAQLGLRLVELAGREMRLGAFNVRYAAPLREKAAGHQLSERDHGRNGEDQARSDPAAQREPSVNRAEEFTHACRIVQ